jgi:type II secretory pathway pseudopilin PulG
MSLYRTSHSAHRTTRESSSPALDATRFTPRAFTLIETVVYLGLLAIIMSGAFASAYGILGSSARNQAKALIQEEGTFLLGKIDWALGGVQSIALPASNASGDMLSVIKYSASPGNPIVVAVSGGNMTIAKGANPAKILNNSNVSVTCAVDGCFSHSASSADGINPESVSASFTVSAKTSEGMTYTQDFSTAKYLRK